MNLKEIKNAGLVLVLVLVRVIFDQWSKLHLGFDAEPEILILKVIFENAQLSSWVVKANWKDTESKTFPENWYSKAPSVGTLLAYLETTA